MLPARATEDGWPRQLAGDPEHVGAADDEVAAAGSELDRAAEPERLAGQGHELRGSKRYQ